MPNDLVFVADVGTTYHVWWVFQHAPTGFLLAVRDVHYEADGDEDGVYYRLEWDKECWLLTQETFDPLPLDEDARDGFADMLRDAVEDAGRHVEW